jgi:hypothetical protein
MTATTKLTKTEQALIARARYGRVTAEMGHGYTGRYSTKVQRWGIREYRAAKSLVAKGLAEVAHKATERLSHGRGRGCTVDSLTITIK